MKLDKKKKLATKVMNVGKGRVIFDSSRLDEIKEAITRQDIRDLLKSGAIKTKPKKSRKKNKKRQRKRGGGKIKKRVKKRKKEYVIITRKLRSYIKELKKQGKVDNTDYRDLRKKIKAREFKDKGHLKNYLNIKKIKIVKKFQQNENKKEKKT